MFQEALQFKNVIIFCYNMQNTIRINGKVPPIFTWHISQIIVDCLFLVVNACVLNQFSNYLLLFDVLQSTITMCLKYKEEITNPPTPVNLINDDSEIAFELSLFVINIKKEICDVLKSNFSFKENMK
jgi:hypothetical protein